MKKKYWLIVLPLFLLFTICYVKFTFALFESNRINTTSLDLAKWQIKVNDATVDGSTSTFTIDNITWTTSPKVKEGKIAPGQSGSFEVTIDPNLTETSIRYDMTFDFSKINDSNIYVTSITEVNGKPIVRSGEYTYSNIITLSEIQNGETNTIKVNLEWINDENNNDKDTYIYENFAGDLRIPVTVTITQHFDGEVITEYTP